MSAERAFSARAALEGEYEIVRELGIGGTAIVYLARKRSTGEEVAIKLIRSAYLEDEEALARFAREARYASRLDHPNVVPIREVISVGNGGVALVMAHVPGRTLKQLIRDEGRLPVARVERVLRDVAAGLNAAHALDIIHRDVKPENIFIDESGDALLADFGLARSMSTGDTQLTMTGVAVGTPTYMPPEQIDGGAIDARGDVYSLGLVTWEMLTGKRPWDGDSLYALLYHQKHDYLPDVREMRNDVPDRLADVVATAIEKEPEARWQSVSEMIAALDGLVPTRPVEVRPEASATVRISRTALSRIADDGSSDGARRATPNRALPSRARDPEPASELAVLAAELEPAVPRSSTLRYFGVLGGAALIALGIYGWNFYQQRSANADGGARALAIANAVARVAAADSANAAGGSSSTVAPESLATLNARRAADSVATLRRQRVGDSLVARAPVAPALDARTAVPLGAPTQSGAAAPNTRGNPRAVTPSAVLPTLPPPTPIVSSQASTSVASTAPAVVHGSIAPGGLHTCFVASDARAYCWGANARGQLGSTSGARASSPSPVAANLQVASIASGLSHSCLIADGGDAWCWGENDHGQLGDRSVGSHASPSRVVDGHAFRVLSAGASHTCGLDIDGLAWCWGAGTRGQLGNGRIFDSNAPVSVSSIRFAAIAAGWNFTCALNVSGKAFCWGENDAGQLGIRDTVDRSLPAAVAPELTFTSIAAGASHACAITADGAAYCWGRNSNGQLGDGTNNPRLAPALVSGDAHFVAITAGAMHSCGITTENVALCWGLNSYGQLGDGTNHGETSPVGVAGGHRFASLHAFGSHTCGITTANEAMCWGYNLEGQLGDGSRANRTRPVYLDLPAVK